MTRSKVEERQESREKEERTKYKQAKEEDKEEKGKVMEKGMRKDHDERLKKKRKENEEKEMKMIMSNSNGNNSKTSENLESTSVPTLDADAEYSEFHTTATNTVDLTDSTFSTSSELGHQNQYPNQLHQTANSNVYA